MEVPDQEWLLTANWTAKKELICDKSANDNNINAENTTAVNKNNSGGGCIETDINNDTKNTLKRQLTMPEASAVAEKAISSKAQKEVKMETKQQPTTVKKKTKRQKGCWEWRLK